MDRGDCRSGATMPFHVAVQLVAITALAYAACHPAAGSAARALCPDRLGRFAARRYGSAASFSARFGDGSDGAEPGTIRSRLSLCRDSAHELGSLEPTKLADAVIFDADPTVDVRNARRVR